MEAEICILLLNEHTTTDEQKIRQGLADPALRNFPVKLFPESVYFPLNRYNLPSRH
jgi:hypothetical protein